MVREGDPAPGFELPDQDGVPVRLSSFRGRRAVVLFFYPKDFTTVCTREACLFRDAITDFRAVDAEVLGASTDSVRSHAAFAKKLGLPYRILSDPKDEVRALYGAGRDLFVLRGRVTFVIDRDGIVRRRIESHFSAAKHVDEAREAAAALARPRASPER